MYLLADIGNTNIVIALFEERDASEVPCCIKMWRIQTDPLKTADEYSLTVGTLFVADEISGDAVSLSLVSSVVPVLTPVFTNVIQRLTKRTPILLDQHIFDILPVIIPESARYEIGSDLVANAVATSQLFKKRASIIVDFGTALTFTALDESAEIRGISIAPGIATAMRALSTNTAQLPHIPLNCPSSSLGIDTTSAMQSGIVLGFLYLVEGLTARIERDLGSSCTLVATGGLVSILSKSSIKQKFAYIDIELTLKGLAFILAFLKKVHYV